MAFRVLEENTLRGSLCLPEVYYRSRSDVERLRLDVAPGGSHDQQEQRVWRR